MQILNFSNIKSAAVKALGYENAHFRRRKKMLRMLSGSGIEIGALHEPVDAPHLHVKYVDRMTTKELREQYPELSRKTLVEPDIIDDAETLASIPDTSLDFVIANHVIEHMKNPISSLLNWQRVLKPGGRLFLAAPDKRKTLDRERELTSIAHLLSDYENPCDQRDFESFKDFALHWTCRGIGARPESEFEQVAKELWDQNYSIHYHVWDFQSFTEFLSYLKKHFETWQFKLLRSGRTLRNEFLFVLEKSNC